jgi:hypothetical protein
MSWQCGACGGPVGLLGTLGRTKHGSCRACGLEQSKAPKGRRVRASTSPEGAARAREDVGHAQGDASGLAVPEGAAHELSPLARFSAAELAELAALGETCKLCSGRLALALATHREAVARHARASVELEHGAWLNLAGSEVERLLAELEKLDAAEQAARGEVYGWQLCTAPEGSRQECKRC